MKIVIVVLMFFLLAAFMIIGNNGLALHEKENMDRFLDLYLEWLNQIYRNTQTITGEAVRLDWLPSES